MNNLATFLLLVSVFCVCCNKSLDVPIKSIELTPPANKVPARVNEVPIIVLEEKKHNDDYWQRFFQTRGAKAVWKELKLIARPVVHVEFTCLNGSPTPDQIYEVTEGIIEYLFENEIQVITLVLAGDSKSGKQLHNLPPTISKLTTLINLGLANNALTDLPQELNKLPKLTKLEIRNNQLKALPASLYFNDLYNNKFAIYGKNNPWLDKRELLSIQEKSNKELSDLLCNKQVVFFSNIWELSGECYLVPFKWDGAAGPVGDISSILASLRGKTIYYKATISGDRKEKIEQPKHPSSNNNISNTSESDC